MGFTMARDPKLTPTGCATSHQLPNQSDMSLRNFFGAAADTKSRVYLLCVPHSCEQVTGLFAAEGCLCSTNGTDPFRQNSWEQGTTRSRGLRILIEELWWVFSGLE